jgi:hypothetical protein
MSMTTMFAIFGEILPILSLVLLFFRSVLISVRNGRELFSKLLLSFNI